MVFAELCSAQFLFPIFQPRFFSIFFVLKKQIFKYSWRSFVICVIVEGANCLRVKTLSIKIFMLLLTVIVWIDTFLVFPWVFTNLLELFLLFFHKSYFLALFESSNFFPFILSMFSEIYKFLFTDLKFFELELLPFLLLFTFLISSTSFSILSPLSKDLLKSLWIFSAKTLTKMIC